MKKKLTLTVIVPAHNEEKTIGNLLKSLISQIEDSYVLEKIAVICDGCTDNTEVKVTEFSKREPRIVCYNDGKRTGRINRLKQAYGMTKSEVIASFDADVVLVDNQVLKELINPFYEDEVVMVQGNSHSANGISLIEKLINHWENIWYKMIIDLDEGVNIYHTFSCCYAVRSNFAKNAVFPKGVISDAKVFYFSAKKMAKRIVFAKKALALYRSPDNIRDYLLRIKRSNNQKELFTSFFGNWIYKEYKKIPYKVKLKFILTSLISHPFLTIMSFIFQITVGVLPAPNNTYSVNGYWTVVESTKKPIIL